MSLLGFDLSNSVARAKLAAPLPNPPNPPNREGWESQGLGRLGTVPGETETAQLSEDHSFSRLKGKLNTVNDVQELSGFLYRQAFDPTLPDWTKKELAAIRLRGRQLACPTIPEINRAEI